MRTTLCECRRRPIEALYHNLVWTTALPRKQREKRKRDLKLCEVNSSRALGGLDIEFFREHSVECPVRLRVAITLAPYLIAAASSGGGPSADTIRTHFGHENVPFSTTRHYKRDLLTRSISKD